jgi:hypothetical protein
VWKEWQCGSQSRNNPIAKPKTEVKRMKNDKPFSFKNSKQKYLTPQQVKMDSSV